VRVAPTAARAARLEALCRWHLEFTQPDNATNRPWALHVFARAGEPEWTLYAETLLHNATASDARHEPLTRWILLDCVRELRPAAP
jgi:EAL domain-containing protein (putative c-di-GMP-specific phosphodiesterase class I)